MAQGCRKSITGGSTFAAWLLSAIVVVLVMLIHVSPVVAEPLWMIAGKESVTSRQAVENVRTYFTRTIVQRYKESDRHNRLWDEDAILLLEAFVTEQVNNTSAAMDTTIPLRDITARELKIAAATRLLDDGCNDAMVRMVMGLAFEAGGQRDEANKCYYLAGAGMVKEGYDPFWAGRSFGFIRNSIPREGDESKRLEIVKMDYMLGQFVAPGTQKPLLDFIYYNLQMDNQGLNSYQAMLAALERLQEPTDPAMVALVMGLSKLREAQRVQTGEEETRNQLMAVARDHLSQAWMARPDLPYAPYHMMQLCMLNPLTIEETRMWFERTFKAQVDFLPACNLMIAALRSQETASDVLNAWIAFAEECMKVDVEKSALPSFCFRLLVQSRTILNTWDWIKDRPDACDLFDRIFKANAQAVSRKELQTLYDNEWESLQVAMTWRAGRYDQARRHLDNLNGQCNDRAFKQFDGVTADAIAQIYINSGPAGPLMLHAQWRFDSGDKQAVLDEVKQIIGQLEPGDPNIKYLNHWYASHLWQYQFATGEWFSLLSESDLYGYELSLGDWRRTAQGGLRGQVMRDNQPLMLIAPDGFGSRLEIRGRMTIMLPDHGTFSGLGLLLDYTQINRSKSNLPTQQQDQHRLHFLNESRRYGNERLTGLFFKPDVQTIVSTFIGVPQATIDGISELATGTFDFYLVAWDGTISLDINGRRVIDGYRPANWANYANKTLGIGGFNNPAGTVMQIDHLEVRRLSTAPALVRQQIVMKPLPNDQGANQQFVLQQRDFPFQIPVLERNRQEITDDPFTQGLLNGPNRGDKNLIPMKVDIREENTPNTKPVVKEVIDEDLVRQPMPILRLDQGLVIQGDVIRIKK